MRPPAARTEGADVVLTGEASFGENVGHAVQAIADDVQSVVIPGTGHFLAEESPDQLLAALTAFLAPYPKVAVAYTQIATIATDEHHELQEFRASVGAQWPFLSDRTASSRRTSTSRSTPTPDNDPMIPHTLVLKPGLVIHSIYNGY